MPGLYDSTSIYDDSLLSYEGEIYNNLNLPTVGVFIAFDDSPYEPNPNWTEVTQYVRSIPSVRRSRSDDWSAFTGSATVVLSNRDQRFNPFNTSSPYNGKLKPRRQIKIVAVSGENNYFLFRGYVAGWPVEWTEQGKDSTVTIECFDALALLADETTPQDLVDSYIRSLDPVFYFPMNDPIDPNSPTKTIKGYGRYAFDLAPAATSVSIINVHQMADGLSPSAIGIIATDADTTRIEGRTTTKPPTSEMTMAGWWSISPDPTVQGGTDLSTPVAAFRFGNLNVLFTHYSSPRYGEIRTRINTGGITTLKRYTIPLYVDQTKPHHLAVTVNADGTIGSFYIDGLAFTVTLAASTSYPETLDLADFYSFPGERQSWVAYNRILTDAEIKTIYGLSNARLIESTPARINRLISFTSFSTALVSTPSSPEGTVSSLTAGGAPVISELNLVRNSEGGELYTSKEGVITVTNRNSTLKGRSATTQAIFKDDGTALKYTGTFTLGYDADNIVNEIRYSVTGGADVKSVDSASQSSYGRSTYNVETQIATVADAQALADSKVAVFGDPVPTVSPFEVGITRSQSDWQTLLGLEVLDQVEITRTPTSGSVFSDRLLINEIVHSITPGDWSMVITGSARYSEWFTIDIDFIDGDRLIA